VGAGHSAPTAVLYVDAEGGAGEQDAAAAAPWRAAGRSAPGSDFGPGG